MAAPSRSLRPTRTLLVYGLLTLGAIVMVMPFLYTLSATATEGTPLHAVEDVLLESVDRVVRDGITDQELARAKAQLHARMVFDEDSITSVAHQFGYFQTIASVDLFRQLPSRIAAVRVDDVHAPAAMLRPANRTVGWFDPLPVDDRAVSAARKLA